ncbi:MAG: hypothetical protein SPK82_00775, partial [Eubacteriales bacterium]|nr:hypothetical protein [Eubacteriales bacterium]
RIRSRAAKPAKYENLWVFIRSDAHVVRAGLNIRGCGPLSTPGFFDRLKGRALALPLTFAFAEKYGLTKKCCCVSVVVLIQFSMQKERREKWSLP